MIKKKARNIAIVTIILGTFLYWQNNDITITNIDYTNAKVPNNFNNYKILHVSDLHNKSFGKNQNKLVKLTEEINPDIIVITGDIIDSRKTNIDIALQYTQQAVNIAPTYYVQGNHESRTDEYTKLEEGLKKDGVRILDNKNEEISINGEKINLIGMKDLTLMESGDKRKEFEEVLSNLKNQSNSNLNILLSHRPELLYLYSRQNIDLVFSGHAHGGQIRLPFTEGLVAPGQGILPKLTSGVHKDKNTEMIVSRGLGNSLFPFRIFNRPELVVTTLKTFNK